MDFFNLLTTPVNLNPTRPMNLTPAESFVQAIYGGATLVDLKFNPVVEVTTLELVQKFRQAQADALRFAVEIQLHNQPLDSIAVIGKLANQLHPLPDDLTDSQKEIIRHFI